jgi:hypothetical protein
MISLCHSLIVINSNIFVQLFFLKKTYNPGIVVWSILFLIITICMGFYCVSTLNLPNVWKVRPLFWKKLKNINPVFELKLTRFLKILAVFWSIFFKHSVNWEWKYNTIKLLLFGDMFTNDYHGPDKIIFIFKYIVSGP